MLRLLLLSSLAFGQDVILGPFLQDPVGDAVSVVWHTSDEVPAQVRHGDGLELLAEGETFEQDGAYRHVVRLDGLVGLWDYAVDGAEPAAVRSPGTTLRIALSADTQRDPDDPLVWQRVSSAIAAQEPHLLVLAGDLVDDSLATEQWSAFHAAAPELLPSVPLLAVLGDEGNEGFVRHLILPTTGPEGFDERTWTARFGRLLLVGVDTSPAGRDDEVLRWMAEELEDACAEVDFVVAVMHHPWRSELHTPDNNDFSGGVVERLDRWSQDCGKPSVHAVGGAHGYARGTSRNARQLWLGVGSGGGALTPWGLGPQEPVQSIAASQPEYGFVVLELTDGALDVTRWGLGTADEPLDPVIREQLRIRSEAADLPAPELDSVAGGFELVEPGDIQAVEWVEAAFCDPDVNPLPGVDLPDRIDVTTSGWVQDRDQVGGEDPPQDLQFRATDAPCVHVRVRDWSLNWSRWRSHEPEATQQYCGCSSAAGPAPLLLFLLLGRRRR